MKVVMIHSKTRLRQRNKWMKKKRNVRRKESLSDKRMKISNKKKKIERMKEPQKEKQKMLEKMNAITKRNRKIMIKKILSSRNNLRKMRIHIKGQQQEALLELSSVNLHHLKIIKKRRKIMNKIQNQKLSLLHYL
jgi:hypothetical protein